MSDMHKDLDAIKVQKGVKKGLATLSQRRQGREHPHPAARDMEQLPSSWTRAANEDPLASEELTRFSL